VKGLSNVNVNTATYAAILTTMVGFVTDESKRVRHVASTCVRVYTLLLSNDYCSLRSPLWNRADHYIFILWFLLSLFLSSFFTSPNISRRRLDVCHTSTHGVPGLSANLRRRSETCCMRLAKNTGRKKVAKIAIWAPSPNFVGLYLRKRRVSTIGKNLLSSNMSCTCPHNVVNFGPLAAEIGLPVCGTPANFNGFRVLAALLHGSEVVSVRQTLRR